jgi:hypothetical protein
LATTTFVDGETVIQADWLNDVNEAIYNPTAAVIPATAIVNTPAGNIAATNVQAALDELDAEKQPLDATLTALASALSDANKIPYATALNTLGELDLSTNTSLGTSDTTIPSQKAVKTYSDTKATIDSPTFTGIPAAPTAVTTTSTTQLATTAFVQQELAGASSMTLLGTLTTTSGTTQTLSGLDLTGYKMLLCSLVGVSVGGSSGDITLGGVVLDDHSTSSNGSEVSSGLVWVDLTEGTLTATVQRSGNTGKVFAADTAYSTASTSITFGAPGAGAPFDAGTIHVWGVK